MQAISQQAAGVMDQTTRFVVHPLLTTAKMELLSVESKFR
jgi:hypothetical protein